MGIRSAFDRCIHRYRTHAAIGAIIHDDAEKLGRLLSKGIPQDFLREANIVWFAIGKPDCLQTLTKHQFDMGQAHDGKTPLDLLLDGRVTPEKTTAETVKMLLDAGADPNGKDRYGRSALQRVCSTSFYHGSAKAQANTESIAAVLIARGAEIDFRDAQGKTALHYAASRGQENLCTQLLNRGANADARDNNNASPLNWAGSAAVETLLLARGAQPLPPDVLPLYKVPQPAYRRDSRRWTSAKMANNWMFWRR